MKIMLMDTTKIVNLILPKNVFGSFWLKDSKGENLISVLAKNGIWYLTSNSEIKIMKNGNPVEEAELISESIYVIKNLLDGKEYALYASNYYDETFKSLMFSMDGRATEIYIGNSLSSFGENKFRNIISYEYPMLAHNQLKFVYNNNQWMVYNLYENIPMYVNGNKTSAEVLNGGDIVFIFGFKITIIRDIFYFNNPGKLVKYDPKFFALMETKQIDYSNIASTPDVNVELYKKEDYFLKPPRFDEQIEEKQFDIDQPPAPQKEEDSSAIMTIGSMLMMGMSSITSGATAVTSLVNGTTTLKTAWPSLLTTFSMIGCMLIMPIISKMYTKHNKKQYEIKRQIKYCEYINKKREEILIEMKKEQQILIDKYIPLKDVGDIILYKKRKLWEKNIEDYDFLSLRLGIGTVPSFFKLSYPEEHFSMEDEDNLASYVRQLGEETKVLNNVPVTYNFIEKYVTAIIGQKYVVDSFLKGLLLQMFAYHAYDDLKIVVFTNSENSKFWDDIKSSPYFWDDNKTIRYYCNNIDDIQLISSYLEELLAQVKEINDSNKNSGDKKVAKLPKKFVIITDDIDSVRNVGIIRTILDTNAYLGISLIVCSEVLNALPNDIEKFISIDEKSGHIFERVLEDSKKFDFYPDFMYSSLYPYVYAVANIPISMNGGKFILPNVYSFLEMYNVSNVNQLNCLEKWKNNDPINSLATPVGVNEYGELFKLDLHEKAHGPHGLIAGMTGSGKSEFIIAFILSAALNFHPYEVQFVLIDYKGGGLAGAFENRETGLKLPHLAGTITNLDVNGINRSLASLQSELKRRQAEFNKARDSVGESTIDIYKYQRLYRNGKVKDPIAHLFIISDEFAELKSQQPEFMDELISTARIGRSLGVHLILATQKPSGVVNDQIWSNSKFKVCLKVQDRSDSQEMIKRPDAASLKETGRFFLQVGYDEFFALGQSAWAGSPYYESDVRKKKVDTSIIFVNNVGTSIKVIDDEKNNIVGVLKGEELPNIMKYIVEVASKENIHVKQLWLNPLSPEILVDKLKEKYNYQKELCNINPAIGEYDAPDLQYQGLLTMPITNGGNWIVYGMADSGKDEVMNSIVYSCITTYEPKELNFYLLDFGSETLRMYKNAPHVGDVLFQGDDDKVMNLFKMVTATIEDRRKKFADFGGNYVTYCKNSGNILPNIVVMINGFETFNENYGDKLFDTLATITRDCQKYGIYFIMSCSTASGIRSKLAQYLPNHLVLQMNDVYDYSTLLSRTKTVPSNYPGRGLVKLEDVYEFQSAIPASLDNLSDFVLEKITALNAQYTDKAAKIPVLPERVSITYCQNAFTGLNAVPVGVEKETLDIRCLNIEKNVGHFITSMEFDNLVQFSLMFIKQLEGKFSQNMYIFDTEKSFENESFTSKYINSNVANSYKEISEKVNEMYKVFTDGGFDSAALDSYSEIVVVIVGIDKFKMLLGDDFNSLFGDVVNKVKAMPKFHFIMVDSADNLKKCEFDAWYKAVVSPTRGIWVGDGIANQYSLKSTLSSRQLSATLDNTFGYYVDGSVTVLVKMITEPSDDEIESL